MAANIPRSAEVNIEGASANKNRAETPSGQFRLLTDKISISSAPDSKKDRPVITEKRNNSPAVCCDDPFSSCVCLKADLHSHTVYGDGTFGFDPSAAYESAAAPFADRPGGKHKLDVLAVTEHGLHLHKQYDKSDTEIDEWDSTIKAAKKANENYDDFYAVTGFEWTPINIENKHVEKNYGHINVLGSKDFCDVRHEGNGNCKTLITSLDDFYKWCLGNEDSLYGGKIVCQFNHPTAYPSSNHFNQLALPALPPEDLKRLKEIFGLCEVGSPKTKELSWFTYEGIGDGENPVKSNEYWYRMALSKGWKVAPVINEDNHLGDYGYSPCRTGIWVNSEKTSAIDKPSIIMEALRARRTFASEWDNTLELKYWWTIKSDGQEKKYVMGQTVEEIPKNIDDCTIKVHVEASSKKKAIGKMSLVIIRDYPQEPLEKEFFKTRSREYSGYKEYPIKDILCQPDIKAVYLKIERPDRRCAICAPVFNNTCA